MPGLEHETPSQRPIPQQQLINCCPCHAPDHTVVLNDLGPLLRTAIDQMNVFISAHLEKGSPIAHDSEKLISPFHMLSPRPVVQDSEKQPLISPHELNRVDKPTNELPCPDKLPTLTMLGWFIFKTPMTSEDDTYCNFLHAMTQNMTMSCSMTMMPSMEYDGL